MHEATTGEQTSWGRKRHLVVDTLGLILSVHVRPAALTDREGGTVVLTALLGTRPRLPVLWAERGSAGHPFTHWGKEHRDGGLHIVTHAWTGIRGVWAPEGTNVDGDTILPTGVPVLPTRGIGERPVSWLTRSRRLSRDGEGTSSSGEAFLSVALTTRMASTLARLRPSMTPLYTLSHTNPRSEHQGFSKLSRTVSCPKVVSRSADWYERLYVNRLFAFKHSKEKWLYRPKKTTLYTASHLDFVHVQRKNTLPE